jgi:hypothetical protein
VTHNRAGAPGRLMHLKRDAPLAAAATMVLDAAERASKLDDAFVVPVLDWGLADDRVYVVTAPWGHTLLTGLAPRRGEGAMIAFIRGQSPNVTAATAALVGELLDFAPEGRPSAETALARLGALLSRLTES